MIYKKDEWQIMQADNTQPEDFSSLVDRTLQVGGADALQALMDRVENEGNQTAKWLHDRLIAVLAKQPQQSDALCLLGSLYSHGRGVEKNAAKAIEFYEQAIKLGHPSAMFQRGLMHKNGEGGNIDYPAAIALFDQAITLGNTTAMNLRGSMHVYGYGGDINYPAAIALFEQAIKLGDIIAIDNRAQMYSQGWGEPNGKSNQISAGRLCLEIIKKAKGKDHVATAMKRLAKFSNQYRSSPAIHYLYLLGQLISQSGPLGWGAPETCLASLAFDNSLSRDEKISYFMRTWLNPNLLDALTNVSAIAGLGELQILIAERALEQSADLADKTEQLMIAQNAFELAEAAREKLSNVDNLGAEMLHNHLHERLILALCKERWFTAQYDAESFVNILTDLRKFPMSPRANFMLMELVQLANLEPYFSSQEKRQLLLILASRADPTGENIDVQRLAAHAKSELKDPHQFSQVDENLRLITFDYLVDLANSVVVQQAQKTDDLKSFNTLRRLLSRADMGDSEVEEAILHHPWVSDALKRPSVTYESVHKVSASMQNDLLQRLDNLADYYNKHPERFISPTLPEEKAQAPKSPGFFHATGNQDNSNNEPLESTEPDENPSKKS